MNCSYPPEWRSTGQPLLCVVCLEPCNAVSRVVGQFLHKKKHNGTKSSKKVEQSTVNPYILSTLINQLLSG